MKRLSTLILALVILLTACAAPVPVTPVATSTPLPQAAPTSPTTEPAATEAPAVEFPTLPTTAFSPFAKTSLYGIFAWVDNENVLNIAKLGKLEKDTVLTNGIKFAMTERNGVIEYYNAAALPNNGAQGVVALGLTEKGYLSVTWSDGAHSPLTNKLTEEEFRQVVSNEEWLEVQMWTVMFESESICFPLYIDGSTRLEAGPASTCTAP